jgi:glutathione S-transferase
MNAYPGPALVTLATSLLLFACAAYVGRCRVRFAIKAPATSGHPQFEIAYRIQMNTLENTVALPAGAVGLCSQPVEPSGRRSSVACGWLADLVRTGLRARPEDARRGFVLSMLAFAPSGWVAPGEFCAGCSPEAGFGHEQAAAMPEVRPGGSDRQAAPGCGRCAPCCLTWRATARQVALALLFLLLAAGATLALPYAVKLLVDGGLALPVGSDLGERLARSVDTSCACSASPWCLAWPPRHASTW